MARHILNVCPDAVEDSPGSVPWGEVHGPWIMSASFCTKKRRTNLDVIQCYAPTNYSDKSAKDDFYSRLVTIIQD